MSKPSELPSVFGTDALVDSEDLMNWLLFNPDVDFETNLTWNPPPEEFNSPPDPTAFGVKYEEPGPSSISPVAEQPPGSWSAPAPAHTVVGGSGGCGSSSSISSAAAKTSAKRSSSSKAAPAAAASTTGTAPVAKKRPRESIEDLEARVTSLKAENADLHAHLLNVTQRTTEVQKQRISMEKLMAAKLAELNDKDEACDQSELASIVKQYTDIYADYGKCRQREVAFHLQQLEKLIVPTTTTKMGLWTLQQDKSFYQRNKSPLYDTLAKELDITAEQTERIQERRARIVTLLGQLRECLELLKNLKVAIEKKHLSYDHICGRVQAAATPKQIVQFQMWITKNAELLSKFIPGFSRSSTHIPNALFVENSLTLSSSIGIKRVASEDLDDSSEDSEDSD